MPNLKPVHECHFAAIALQDANLKTSSYVFGMSQKPTKKPTKKPKLKDKARTAKFKATIVKAKAKNSSEAMIWPQERDTMTRPDRLRYVRQLKSNHESCVFCEAFGKGLLSFDSLLLYETSLSMVILNKYPYNTGHLLVLPKRHEGQLDLLSLDEINDLAQTVQKCVGILKQVYNCQGLNLGLNLGAVAGAGIPEHLHWHIIPRWFGDTNFFPLIAETKVLVESLETTYNRLRPYF